MVKAFITGRYICHTTNILNYAFRIVHWILASLSLIFLMEILFLLDFLLLKFSFPFQMFVHFYFLSRQKYESTNLSYLKIQNFFFGKFYRKIPLSLSGLFCCTHINTALSICQYYFKIFFKLFFFCVVLPELSEYLALRNSLSLVQIVFI